VSESESESEMSISSWFCLVADSGRDGAIEGPRAAVEGATGPKSSSESWRLISSVFAGG
jgi:hypothetical protein